jgi:hypothetical protein
MVKKGKKGSKKAKRGGSVEQKEQGVINAKIAFAGGGPLFFDKSGK